MQCNCCALSQYYVQGVASYSYYLQCMLTASQPHFLHLLSCHFQSPSAQSHAQAPCPNLVATPNPLLVCPTPDCCCRNWQVQGTVFASTSSSVDKGCRLEGRATCCIPVPGIGAQYRQAPAASFLCWRLHSEPGPVAAASKDSNHPALACRNVMLEAGSVNISTCLVHQQPALLHVCVCVCVQPPRCAELFIHPATQTTQHSVVPMHAASLLTATRLSSINVSLRLLMRVCDAAKSVGPWAPLYVKQLHTEHAVLHRHAQAGLGHQWSTDVRHDVKVLVAYI